MQVHFITRGHVLWEPAVAHVRQVYARCYGAQVTGFARELAVATDAAGAVSCVAGMRHAGEGLFSQVYLDAPLNEVLGRHYGDVVLPGEIVEIASMACARPAVGLPLLDAMTDRGRAAGMRYAVFTATRPLWTMLERAGVPLARLAPARADRVADPASWGGYYDTDPWVCAVNEPLGQRLRFSPRRHRPAPQAPARLDSHA